MIICDLFKKEFMDQSERIVIFEGFQFMIRVEVQALPEFKEGKRPEHICEACKWKIVAKLCSDA